MGQDRQHAIVTGGSSGIGLAIAIRLATSGMDVSLVARGRQRLEEAQRAVEAARRDVEQRVTVFTADVAVEAEVTAALDSAIDALGPPNLLVTSAGIAVPGRFQVFPVAVHERTMAVNYFGTLYSIRACVPAMVARGTGAICLVSSGAGLIGLFGYTPYSPAKFALRGLAESLRAELRPQGVRVSIVYPPDTRTPQLDEENKTKPEETKRMTGTARTWSADDVARVTIRGIERGAFGITPGLEMTLLYRLNSLVVPALARHFDRIVDSMRRSR